MPADLVEFQQHLEAVGEDYLLLELSVLKASAYFRFMDVYQGRTVIWDCHLVTLKAEYENLRASGNNPGELANFIEIKDNGGQLIPLRVGLNIPRIDIPAIRKMIVMIRQYKRLGPGRQEFGNSYQVN